MYGYIYVRDQRDYAVDNVYKIGKTTSPRERNNTYKTGECCEGFFLKIYRFDESIIDSLERKLQKYLEKKNLHFESKKTGSGTEFFKRDCLPFIDKFFEKTGLDYYQLSPEEIFNINWNKKEEIDEDYIDNIDYLSDEEPSVETVLTDSVLSESGGTVLTDKSDDFAEVKINPREDQLEIIEQSVEYFKESQKGLLVLTCGVGKTLISLWIAERLGAKSVLIGVPNLELLNQWRKEITKVFSDVEVLLVCSGVDSDEIENFLDNPRSRLNWVNQNTQIMITTYSSAYKVLKATKKINYTFDFCINDETHHLTTNNIEVANEKKSFIKMLSIDSKNQLSLTATMKTIDPEIVNKDSVISNDCIETFGNIITKRCLLWGIQKEIVCDYEIQTLLCDIQELYDMSVSLGIENEFSFMMTYSDSNETDFEQEENNDINNFRFFLSAFVALKSISENHCKHILIYTNNRFNAEKVDKYIKFFLKKDCFPSLKNNLFSSSYLGLDTVDDKKKRLNKFIESEYGILSCVYCLGEGWNCPILHGTVFAENMSSNIRIVQSALRASRKCDKIPDKIAKIIIPILNTPSWLNDKENVDFKKVREIIYQMGVEDETVCEKIKAFKLKLENKPSSTDSDFLSSQKSNIAEYDEKITSELRLKAIPREKLGYSYEKARNLLKEYNLKTIEEYYDLCDKNIYFPKNPETVYENKFTNWVHYLSIGKVYYDLETCKEKLIDFIYQKDFTNDDLFFIMSELRKSDNQFPPPNLWKNYYNLDDICNFINIDELDCEKIDF